MNAIIQLGYLTDLGLHDMTRFSVYAFLLGVV